jgi:hypothetical protein
MLQLVEAPLCLVSLVITETNINHISVSEPSYHTLMAAVVRCYVPISTEHYTQTSHHRKLCVSNSEAPPHIEGV